LPGKTGFSKQTNHMQKLNTWLAALLVLSIFACGKKETALNAEDVHFNDFEAHFGNNDHVFRGKGHSGLAYFEMDSAMQYSLGFSNLFEKISTKPYQKVKISAWILLSDRDASADLVMQVWTKDQPIKIEQKKFSAKELGANKWKLVEMECPLAGLYAPSNRLSAFVFKNTPNPVFIDDFKVELIP
jgi:hypothetical protein